MTTVGFGFDGGTGRFCFASNPTCSCMPQRALYRQSSTECPMPVKPSNSVEKKPKKSGSAVASMTNEYGRLIILSFLFQSYRGFLMAAASRSEEHTSELQS